MSYKIERTESELVIRLAEPVTGSAINEVLNDLNSLSILEDLVEDMPAEELLSAASVLNGIKDGIGQQTRDFLYNNEEFNRLISEEE